MKRFDKEHKTHPDVAKLASNIRDNCVKMLDMMTGDRKTVKEQVEHGCAADKAYAALFEDCGILNDALESLDKGFRGHIELLIKR